ncbi:MAG: Gfo/Idh/MocA family oxidoreductase, partial [Clostridia bacterium]
MEKEIRLAMVGMVDGNGHPYSWSAICNGYDEKEMAKCPYPVIPVYLGRQPRETLQIPGVRVTHIWTDDPEDAKRVSAASLIPHVAKRPEDVIGQVDGVMIPTDKGWEHVERASPFIEAGLPLFIDKPLCDNAADLETFLEWQSQGKRFLSSSS